MAQVLTELATWTESTTVSRADIREEWVRLYPLDFTPKRRRGGKTTGTHARRRILDTLSRLERLGLIRRNQHPTNPTVTVLNPTALRAYTDLDPPPDDHRLAPCQISTAPGRAEVSVVPVFLSA